MNGQHDEHDDQEERLNLLPALGRDFRSIFSSRNVTWAILALSLLLQIAYWYFGAPLPGTPRDPLTGLRSVLWALLLLFLIPLLLARPLELDGRSLGLSAGDRRLGRQALLLGIPAAVLIGFLGSFDSGIRFTYPWAGAWAGGSWLAFLSWSAIYALYYLAYEFFYRGLLLRGLAPSMGWRGALWLQTVASALLHLGKPLAETIAAVPAGLLFGVIAWRTRSVLYVFLIHLALGVSTDFFSLLQSGHLAFGGP